MSVTTSCSPSNEPGCISLRPMPITIEQAEPGGVSCTTLIPSAGSVSWSTVNPSFSA